MVASETRWRSCLESLCPLGPPYLLSDSSVGNGRCSFWRLLLCPHRRSFNISFGSSSWFAHSSCGHRPVPKCQAPSGRLGIFSSEFRHLRLPQHAWLPGAFIPASRVHPPWCSWPGPGCTCLDPFLTGES